MKRINAEDSGLAEYLVIIVHKGFRKAQNFQDLLGAERTTSLLGHHSKHRHHRRTTWARRTVGDASYRGQRGWTNRADRPSPEAVRSCHPAPWPIRRPAAPARAPRASWRPRPGGSTTAGAWTC